MLSRWGEVLKIESQLYIRAFFYDAKQARRCLFCDHRIEPLELHFLKDGSYICQSGTRMDPKGKLMINPRPVVRKNLTAAARCPPAAGFRRPTIDDIQFHELGCVAQGHQFAAGGQL